MNNQGFTQVPNVFYPLYTHLSNAELRVFLVIERHTIGFHKAKDRISYSQFEKETGLWRQAIRDGILGLEKKGFIHRDDDFAYGLNLEYIRAYTDQFDYQTREIKKRKSGLKIKPDQFDNQTKNGKKSVRLSNQLNIINENKLLNKEMDILFILNELRKLPAEDRDLFFSQLSPAQQQEVLAVITERIHNE